MLEKSDAACQLPILKKTKPSSENAGVAENANGRLGAQPTANLMLPQLRR